MAMISTSSFTLAAAIVATMLVLASSAPLRVHERKTREVTQEDMLTNISVGVEVLRSSSILELMEKMNLTAAVTPCSLFDSEHERFRIALDITCDLYHAKTELLPNIVNNRTITKVVKTLNAANLEDAFSWLEEEATKLSVHYNSGVVSADHICKRWSSINKFTATRNSLRLLAPDMIIDSTKVQTWLDSNEPELGWVNGENLAARLTCSL